MLFQGVQPEIGLHEMLVIFNITDGYPSFEPSFKGMQGKKKGSPN